MKRILLLFFTFTLLTFYSYATNPCVYIDYPTLVPTSGVFKSINALIPCNPLKVKFNINDLQNNNISGFTISMTFSYEGKNTVGDDYSIPALLGSTLADSNNPINLAVCSVNSLSNIQIEDVQIVKWNSKENIIKINFKNIQNWNGDDVYIYLFFGSGNYPHSGNYYTNFPQNKNQKPTFLSLSSIDWNNYFDLSYPVYLNVNFSLDNTNVDIIPSTVKLFKFDNNMSWSTDTVNTIGTGKKFDKLVVADVGVPPEGGESLPISMFGWFTKDYISISSEDKTLNILFGEDPSGRIRSAYLPYTPVNLSCGDVDGDGKNEILVAGSDGSLNIYKLSDLTFSKYGILPQLEFKVVLPENVIDSYVDDINGDGKFDYIYIGGDTDKVYILYGDDFSNSVSYDLDGIPKKLVSGDFNGDDLKDICIAKVSGNNVAVLYNNGDGSFDLEEKSMVNSIPLDNVDRGDFDRDGVDDVAFTSSDNDGIVVAKGSSEGLKYEDFIGLTCSPSAVSVENFDGQHGDDVLVGFSDYYKLLLCTSDENGDIVPNYSINTIEDVSVDPNGDTVLPEDGIVNVVMGVSYGGVNDRSGISAISKNHFNVLFFPEFKNISFSIINPKQDQNMNVNFNLYDEYGTLDTYKDISINKSSQYARYFSSDEIFGDLPDNNQYVKVFITDPRPYGMYLLNNPTNPHYLDGGKNLSAYDIAGKLYIPIIKLNGEEWKDNEKTVLYLINPFKDTSQHVTLNLYYSDDSEGYLVESKSIFLFKNQKREIDLKNFFSTFSDNYVSDCSSYYVEISSNEGVIATEAFGDFSNNLACMEGLKQNSPTKTLYCPHVAWGKFGNINYYSELNLINVSDTPGSDQNYVNVKIELYSDTGELVKSGEVMMGHNAKLFLDLENFFDIHTATTGYLKIYTDDNVENFKMIGAITFGDADNSKFMASLPLSSAPGNFITGHIANGEIGDVNYFTGLAILSPYDDSNVTIECFNQDGLKVAEKNININRGTRYVKLFSEIFPDLGDMFGGYVKIRSTEEEKLFVFQLFGDNDLNFLSAVPAVEISNEE